MRKKAKDTMTGAMLPPETRAKLERIVQFYRRTFKAQLIAWIETETRLIERS